MITFLYMVIKEKPVKKGFYSVVEAARIMGNQIWGPEDWLKYLQIGLGVLGAGALLLLFL